MNKNYLNKVVIKFAGDSGDGIQLLGNKFSDLNIKDDKINDIYTLVEFPPEIRAPAGSISGISSFQISISSEKIYNTENDLDILIAFNPAALKLNIHNLKQNGILIIDLDTFNEKNLKKAKLENNPITENNLEESYRVIKIPITQITYDAVKESINSITKANRCRNFFILGLICWLFEKSTKDILTWIDEKFKKASDLIAANKKALIAGFNYGETLELIHPKIIIPQTKRIHDNNNRLDKISGNKAFCLGAITSSLLFNSTVFASIYPITPASDILHELSYNKNKEIITVQLEDEIAAISSVIGAAYGGTLAFTATSGPGLDLMQETIGLGIMARLPFVVINIQRSGPSTGIPTKSEQTDLLASIFGRHGESTAVVLAANSPADCYWSIIEAFSIALSYLGPVIILSDANLANSSELWTIPDINTIKNKINIDFIKLKDQTTAYNSKNKKQASWLIPGLPENIRCLGGLEKDYNTNMVSHDPDNHNRMVIYRNDLLNNVSELYGELIFFGPKNATLIITWGSVYGITKSIYNEIKDAYQVALTCIRHISPFHNNLKDILKTCKKIIIIEENLGQLALLIKAKYSVNVTSINQISGQPFKFNELKAKIIENIIHDY